jgi:hypothetical protein
MAVSDTIITCRRVNPGALDDDLEPIELNHALIQQIRNSAIDRIYFTSGFGRNNAFRLFYRDILGRRIPAEMRKTREMVTDPAIFGRPVRLSVLYSPSGNANRGIARGGNFQRQRHLYSHYPDPVQQFKINDYRAKFAG